MWFGWEIRLGGCKSGYGKECLKPEWGKIDYSTNDFRFPFVNSFTYSPSIYWADIVALMIQSYARHSPFLFIDKMKKAKAIYSELAIARESATFWASQVALVAQLVKNLPVMWETWGWILGWENPWGRTGWWSIVWPERGETGHRGGSMVVGARLSGAAAGNPVMTWRMLFIYGI